MGAPGRRPLLPPVGIVLPVDRVRPTRHRALGTRARRTRLRWADGRHQRRARRGRIGSVRARRRRDGRTGRALVRRDVPGTNDGGGDDRRPPGDVQRRRLPMGNHPGGHGPHHRRDARGMGRPRQCRGVPQHPRAQHDRRSVHPGLVAPILPLCDEPAGGRGRPSSDRGRGHPPRAPERSRSDVDPPPLRRPHRGCPGQPVHGRAHPGRSLRRTAG